MKTLYQKIFDLQKYLEIELKARREYYDKKPPAWKKSDLARVHDITTDGLFGINDAIKEFIKKSMIKG